MWTGQITGRRALVLIQGLYSEVESRFRAAVLRDHPPAASDARPGWKGWTPATSALVLLANLKISELSKRTPKQSDLLSSPGEAVKRHAPKTTADFGREFRR